MEPLCTPVEERATAWPPRLGALEARVMDVLWANGPLAVRGIIDALDDEPAYTTIATVLGNLCRKQLVGADKQGRATLYGAFADRDEQAALVMLHALEQSADRRAALHHLVNGLGRDDHDMLLSALRSDASGGPSLDDTATTPPTPGGRRVVLHADAAGSLERALSTASTLRRIEPGLGIRIIMNGPGVDDALGDEPLETPRGVEVLACSLALSRRGASPEQLRPGTATVPSSAVELVRAQLDGAAYVRL